MANLTTRWVFPGVLSCLLLGATACNGDGTDAPATPPPVPAQTVPVTATPSPTLTTHTAAPSPSAGSPSPAKAAAIHGCDGKPVARPDSLVLFCADAGEVLTQLSWSNWGQPTATATAQLARKSCNPNCAAGGTDSFRATVTVGGLTQGSYTTLHLVAPQAPSDSTEDFTLEPTGPRVVNH